MIDKEKAVELGNDLKKYREARALSIDDISSILKIRKFYLQKIEDGDVDIIPGIAYQKLYLRTYCNFLEVPYDNQNFQKVANENLTLYSNVDDSEQLQSYPSRKVLLSVGILLSLILLYNIL